MQAQEQKKLKPKIEDIASEYLDGEDLNNLLDFVTWMRANRITPTFANKNKNGINYTSHICFVKLVHKEWEIAISGKHRKHKSGFQDDFFACEELKEIIAANLSQCEPPGCGHGCPPYTAIICGTKYENVCRCLTVRFYNPNAGTLEIIKKVIAARNNAGKTGK